MILKFLFLQDLYMNLYTQSSYSLIKTENMPDKEKKKLNISNDIRTLWNMSKHIYWL